VPADADAREIADVRATLADLLVSGLADIAPLAADPGDRGACKHAAASAAETHRLLARTGDETVVW